jgi:cytochrome c biogenesis protein CcmG/thiol:disulfide interchange protein DsbE
MDLQRKRRLREIAALTIFQSSARTQTTESSSEERRPRSVRSVALVVPVLVVTVALILVGLLAYGVIARAPDTSIDDSLAHNQAVAAPPYRLAVLRHGSLGPGLERKLAPALADGHVSPTELRGTPYVLNIWASWCVPCRDEAPELVREWRRTRPRGVLFVGLDMQDAPADARDFLDRFGIDYLNIRDPTNETSHRYSATGVPETFFVSAHGDIVSHIIGVVTPAQLREGVTAAVAGRPAAARQGGARRSTA